MKQRKAIFSPTNAAHFAPISKPSSAVKTTFSPLADTVLKVGMNTIGIQIDVKGILNQAVAT